MTADSNHPHVVRRRQFVPLLDWLPRIGCDRAALQRVLADNPAQLYGFS